MFKCFNEVLRILLLILGVGFYCWCFLMLQIGSAVGGTTSAFYGFNHGIIFIFFVHYKDVY